MKKIILAAATVLLASATALYAQSASLNPGDKLPAASKALRNATAGDEIKLSNVSGKNGLLVMFSCNTCLFVIRNQAVTMKTIQYAQMHDIGVVILNSNAAKRNGDDSYKAMKEYAKEQRYTVPYVVDEDSKLADAFGAGHTPEIYLFNKDNILVYKGAMNDNPGNPTEAKTMYIREAIDALVAGKKIDPSVTKSVGCGIKRKA